MEKHLRFQVHDVRVATWDDAMATALDWAGELNQDIPIYELVPGVERPTKIYTVRRPSRSLLL